MAMTKAAGDELLVGVTSTGIDNIIEQSLTKKNTGELKEFKDKDGETVSVYAVGKGKEITFEAIMKSSVNDKVVGDKITINSVDYYVTDWTVTESNEDAKKVSCTARSFDDLSSST